MTLFKDAPQWAICIYLGVFFQVCPAQAFLAILTSYYLGLGALESNIPSRTLVQKCLLILRAASTQALALLKILVIFYYFKSGSVLSIQDWFTDLTSQIPVYTCVKTVYCIWA
jgi:hypothetical protein